MSLIPNTVGSENNTAVTSRPYINFEEKKPVRESRKDALVTSIRGQSPYRRTESLYHIFKANINRVNLLEM